MTDYLADRNARPIALSISLAYDKVMRKIDLLQRFFRARQPMGRFDLVLLILVIAVLVYLFA